MEAITRGADRLVASMKQAGVRRIFSLSGNHIMPLYDALVGQGIELLHVRHEAAALHMADAWARLTGQVGVALVTGGPGHANAVSALYTALMSESPVILLSGHAALSMQGRGAFQEMDQVAMARPVVKAAWASKGPDAIAEDFAQAWQLAQSGRPGPVHLSLPVDVLEAVTASAPLPQPARYAAQLRAVPAASACAILARLRTASRPIVLVGPQGLTTMGRQRVAALQAALRIPVIATESPRGINDPALGALAPVLAQADCVLLIGKRLDFTLAHGLAPAFEPSCTFLQVDADQGELERSARAVGTRLEQAYCADAPAALQALADLAAQQGCLNQEAWQVSVQSALDYRPPEWERAVPQPQPQPQPQAGVSPALLCKPVQALLDSHPDAVLVVDGGEFGQWAQACLTAPHRIINGAAGAIGVALPMAVAAKLAYPDAPVVAMMGDGTFGFHCAELDTALRSRAPILCIVGNDARWNAEYQIQLREFGEDRAHGCTLLPTRYDQVACALGGYGEYVDSPDALPGALSNAVASGLPSCINVQLAGRAAPVIRRS